MISTAENQLASQIAYKLLREMQYGKYRNATRLPPETELAASLGISRTAVRDALSTMEREGFVSRCRGIGTIINRHVLDVPVRIDLECEFFKIIKNAGYRPGLSTVSTQTLTAGDEVARRLSIDPENEVLAVERIVTATGTPAIRCIDYIPVSAIKRPYDKEVLNRPIFDFLQNNCDLQCYMDLTDIHAVNADRETAAALGIEEGTAVLKLDEVWFDFDGAPLFYALEYYREGLLTHTILRKRLD